MQVLRRGADTVYRFDRVAEVEVARSAASSLLRSSPLHLLTRPRLRSRLFRFTRRTQSMAVLYRSEAGSDDGFTLDPDETALFRDALEWHVSRKGLWPTGYTNLFEKMLILINAEEPQGSSQTD